MKKYPIEQILLTFKQIRHHLSLMESQLYVHIQDAVLVFINPMHTNSNEGIGSQTILEVTTYNQNDPKFISLLNNFFASIEYFQTGTKHKHATLTGCIAINEEGMSYIKELNRLKEVFCFWAEVIIRDFKDKVEDDQWIAEMENPPNKIDVKKRIELNKELFTTKIDVLKVRKKIQILPKTTFDWKMNWRKTRKQHKISTKQMKSLIQTNFKNALINDQTDIDEIIKITQLVLDKGGSIYSIETYLPNIAITFQYTHDNQKVCTNKSSLGFPVFIESKTLPKYDIRCSTVNANRSDIPAKYEHIKGTRKLFRVKNSV